MMPTMIPHDAIMRFWITSDKMKTKTKVQSKSQRTSADVMAGAQQFVILGT